MSDALRLYGYGPCSTCRRALAWLAQRGVVVEVIDITIAPPPLALLRQALTQFGDRRRLFNTSGKSYRQIGAETLKAMDDDAALAALAADGRLVRRPFLVAPSGQILTGFKEPEWEHLISP